MSSVHPKELYQSMLQGKVHPRKAKGLEIINEICSQRFESKAMDWGINSIGRVSESRGGPSSATLHLPRQEYYRALIKAWQSHAEASYPAAKQKITAQADDWIRNIENISSRTMASILKSELTRANEEVKMLRKLIPNGVIELRQPANLVSSPAGMTVEVTILAHRECSKFVKGPLQSTANLADMGLKITKAGDLVSGTTGEVVLGKGVIDLLRAVVKLA